MKVVLLAIMAMMVMIAIIAIMRIAGKTSSSTSESFRGAHSCNLATMDDQHPDSIYSGARVGHPRNVYGAISAESVLNCSVCQACMDPAKACQSSCRQCCFRCGICRCNPRLKRDSKKYINAPLYAEDKKGEKEDDEEEDDISS